MKAASRVQCYDNRDVYFFCLGSLRHPPCACPPSRTRPAGLGRFGCCRSDTADSLPPSGARVLNLWRAEQNGEDCAKCKPLEKKVRVSLHAVIQQAANLHVPAKLLRSTACRAASPFCRPGPCAADC
jgi:hypothetical protein